MGTWLRVTYEVTFLLLVFLPSGLLTGCTPTIPLSTPPENYKGPTAEQPVIQQGEYWIYERANLTKARSTALAANMGFPLWIGKTWSYEGSALPSGQTSTSKAFRIPTRIDCQAVGFGEVTATAGTFGAFQCECQCTVLTQGYNPDCGKWTIWYAPEVKNIIKRKTESTATTMELVEYKASRPDAKFEATGASMRRALVRGEIKEALAFYEEAAQQAEQKQDWVIAARQYLQASNAARYTGQLQKQISHATRALEIADKTKSAGLRASVAQRLIYAYRDVRNFEKAREFLDKAFEIIKEIPNDSSRAGWEGSLNLELGRDLIRRREYDKAIDALSQSLRIREAQLSKYKTTKPNQQTIEDTQSSILLVLTELATSFRRAGQPQKALEQYQRAFNSTKEWGLRYAWEEELHRGMGEIYLQQKNFPQALESFIKALSIAENQGYPSEIRWASDRIGDILRQTGKPADALSYYQKAIQQIESTRSLLESADYRQSYFEGALDTYVKMMNALLLARKFREAFDYTEKARSRAFLDVLGSKVQLSRLKGGLLEEERSLQERIASTKARVSDEATGADRDVFRRQLAEAERAYNAFLAKVRKQDKEQASLMTVEPLTLKGVQELLDPGVTLLSYFVTSENVRIWVIDKDRMNYVRANIPRKLVATWVKSYRDTNFSLGEKEKSDELSVALYQLLIQRVLPFVRGKQLIIVPHDVLHYLPFHALLSSDGKYLIEKYPIYYLSSASLLQFTKEKRKAMGEKVLALGNPDLGDPKMSLQFAELEAKEIQGLYPQSTVLLKREATEEKGKGLSPQHDIVHFATHAELDENDPLSSAVLLAKDGKEDGRLEVREIFSMDLKANLVVLSACETGLGKLSSGDELVGLTRAFIYAGTPSVVASLWKVEDSSTAKLMASFYRNLKTMSKVEALRQAQLELITGKASSDLLARRGVGGIGRLGETPQAKPSRDSVSVPISVSTSHPYFWAPFILVGDGK